MAVHDDLRVALCFVTRGPMPLEPVWSVFFQTAADVAAPLFTKRDVDSLLEQKKLRELDSRLLSAGTYTASSAVQRHPCTNDSLVRVRPRERSSTARASTLHCALRLHAHGMM